MLHTHTHTFGTNIEFKKKRREDWTGIDYDYRPQSHLALKRTVLLFRMISDGWHKSPSSFINMASFGVGREWGGGLGQATLSNSRTHSNHNYNRQLCNRFDIPSSLWEWLRATNEWEPWWNRLAMLVIPASDLLLGDRNWLGCTDGMHCSSGRDLCELSSVRVWVATRAGLTPDEIEALEAPIRI